MKKNIMRILKGELIGLEIEIPAQKLKGTIINETKHTFEIFTKNEKILIDGKIIEHQPENRIKKIK